MRFGSVCSGIEAASVAWNPLGWKASWLAEIEPFPCGVLAHHYPDTPNLGDMTKFQEWPDVAIDLLCGGTPCQSFSVAGLRKGLDDPRGNLMLTFGAIAAKSRPKWLVWENVPGVLSSNGGGDFGSFLGMLGQLGYGFAYRVLDAQHFGVPQRRRRVFVVGCLGDWRSAAAVLFERHSLSGHPAPRREAGKAAPTIPSRSTAGGGLGTDFDCDGGVIAVDWPHQVAGTLDAHYGDKMGLEDQHIFNQRASRFVASAFDWQSGGDSRGLDPKPTAQLQSCQVPAIAIQAGATRENPESGPDGVGVSTTGVAYTLEARAEVQAVQTAMQVRRLTPRECERLQGFPDDYTAIPWRGKAAGACPDGPRYKALGNSWAVPVARWIGERIQAVEQLTAQELEAA